MEHKWAGWSGSVTQDPSTSILIGKIVSCLLIEAVTGKAFGGDACVNTGKSVNDTAGRRRTTASASLGTPQGSLRILTSLSSLYLSSLLSLKRAFSNYSFGVFKHCQKVGQLALPCSPQTCLPAQAVLFAPVRDKIRGGAGELRHEFLALLLHSVTPKPSHGCICSFRSAAVPYF